MSDAYVIHVSRWFFLRIWPGVWLRAMRDQGTPLWHPFALMLLVAGAWVIAFSRGDE